MDQFTAFVQVLKIIGIVCGAFWTYGRFMERVKEQDMKIDALEKALFESKEDREKLENKIDLMMDKLTNIQIELASKQNRH